MKQVLLENISEEILQKLPIHIFAMTERDLEDVIDKSFSDTYVERLKGNVSLPLAFNKPISKPIKINIHNE